MTEQQPLAEPIPAVCSRLGISRSLLYKEIREGRIKALKAGKRTLVSLAEQERWLNALPTVAA